MKGALASNWVVEVCESRSGGFKLLGSSKGYTTFAKAFNTGDKVFYAVHDENGNREAGWGIANGQTIDYRNPTATLIDNVYREGDIVPQVNFSGQVNIACTFNAVAFDTIWDHVFREDNPHNVTADQVPQDPANGRGDNVQDALDNISEDLNEHKADKDNPHEVKAPQVDLEPVLLPLGPNDQNVQAALEWLYSYFTEHGGGDWHLTHIDGNYVYIEIKHGPRSEFPPTIVDLDLAELKLNHDDGQLWTRLADDTIVKIGDKDLITEAPKDGELYGRKDGEWHRISLATVSDNMPQNPQEGDLWVDTAHTLELFVFIAGSGWVSMTGAGSGGGGLADNIVLDDMDGTLVNILLGREMLEDGSARWRPIYSSDVIPADGANPMTRADGSTLRNQADINKFLYNSIGEIDGNYVPVSGGEFEGPIFGPSVNDIVRDREVTLEVSGLGANPHDDPTCPPDKVVVQTRFAAGSLGGGIDNRMKIHMPKGNADDYCGKKDIEYAIVQNKGVQQIWTCNDSGFSSDDGKTLNVVCEDVYGLSLTEGAEVEIWRTEAYATPYVTLDMLYKIMTNIDAGASVTIDTQAPANPTDGDLWFDNTENVMQLFVWHEDSDAWLPVAPPATLESRVRQGEITQEAIIAQIQESLEEQERIRGSIESVSSDIDGKVSLSGTNVLDQDAAWRLRQVNTDTGALNTFVSINRGGMSLYNVNYPSNAEHGATKGYVDDQDAIIREQLRQTTVITEEHKFKFTVFNVNPRSGEFNFQDFNRQITANPDEALYMAFSNYDFDGDQWNNDKPNSGDTIRIENGDDYLLFNILEGATGFYAIEKVEGNIAALETWPVYDLSFFIDIDPNEIAYKGYVDAAIANNRGDIDVNQYPTTEYVEERLDEKLNKSGGTMTGDLSLKRTDDSYWTYIRSQKPDAWNTSQETHGLIIDIGDTNSYKHQFKIIGRSGKDLFEMHDDGKAQARLLGNLDVANILKQGGYPVATQVYVQQAVAGIEIPEAVEVERPVLWKYNPDVAANALGDGEFNFSADRVNAAAGEWSIFFAKRDANGQYWYPHDNGNAYTHTISEQMATVRGREQNCVHGKTKQWLFNQGTNNYAQLKLTYYRSSNAVARGKYYLITIPGYMPFFTFSTDAQSNGTHP